MNSNQKEPTLGESIQQVMKTLPPFLRAYLAEGKYTPVAQSLMSKYKLRIDQGGILERELLLLLMGIENPTEFTQALTDEAKIGPETMSGLVKDVNDMIFVPLRKQEEALTKGAAQPGQAPVRPAMPAPQPRPQVVVFNQQPKPAAPAPAHIAPLPPKTVMPSGMTLHDAVRAALGAKSAEKLMLEDHEEPHIDVPSSAPKAQAPAVPASPAAPIPMPTAPAAVQRPQPPVPAAPAAPVPPPSTPPATPGIPQVTKTPPQPVTSYSVDPYREPIDEN